MKRFSNILLVADSARADSVALKRAIELAKTNQAKLTVVDIVKQIPGTMQMAIVAMPYNELIEFAIAEKRVALDEVAAVGTTKGVGISVDVLVGKAFLEIVRKVLRDDHDLVIKAAASPDRVKNVLFGSTDMHLMRKCPCPVWITKSSEVHRYRRIIAAVDNDPDEPATEALNQKILEMSVSLAISESSELHVVHAWQLAHESYLRSARTGIPDDEIDVMVAEEHTARRKWLERLVADYTRSGDKEAIDLLQPELHLTEGAASYVVPEEAAELGADLVVMGTVARTGIAGILMGNTAEDILAQIDCSVLTVKPPGFVSPVTLKS